jgi:short-subunit dehydrogenase
MDKQLKDKKILLLGCSGILGSEFTDFLYKNGANLVLADLRSNKFDNLKKNYPKSYYVDCDVTKENDIKKLKSIIKKNLII